MSQSASGGQRADAGNRSRTLEDVLSLAFSLFTLGLRLRAGPPVSGGFRVSRAALAASGLGLAWRWLSDTGSLCCVSHTLNLAGASHTQRNVWMDPLHSHTHCLFACVTLQQQSDI